MSSKGITQVEEAALAIKKSGLKFDFKILPGNFKAQRAMDFARSSILEANKVRGKLDNGFRIIFQNEKEAFYFQDRLMTLYENPDVKNAFLDEIVAQLNKNKGAVAGSTFNFMDSKIYAKIKSTAAQIHQNGVYDMSGPESSLLKAFGCLDAPSELPVESLADNVFSFRVKSEDGIAKKLIRKYNTGKLPSDFDAKMAQNAIGDLFGERIQIKSLTPSEAAEVVTSLQDNLGMPLFKSFEEFRQEIILYCSNSSKRPRDVERGLEALKLRQTKDVAQKLIHLLETGELKITEISNYGDEITSYFTAEQLCDFARAHRRANESILKSPGLKIKKRDGLKFKHKKTQPPSGKFKLKSLPVVTKPKESMDPTKGAVKSFGGAFSFFAPAEFISKGATKSTGYSSFHLNMRHRKPHSNEFYNGELQIRGSELNELGEIEHKIYDCFSGKISHGDKKLGKVMSKLSGMSKEQSTGYEKYISELYHWKRLLELGIEIPKPVFNKAVTGLDERFSLDGLKYL